MLCLTAGLNVLTVQLELEPSKRPDYDLTCFGFRTAFLQLGMGPGMLAKPIGMPSHSWPFNRQLHVGLRVSGTPLLRGVGLPMPGGNGMVRQFRIEFWRCNGKDTIGQMAEEV